MRTLRASLDMLEGNFAVVYSDENDNKKLDIPRELVSPNI